MAGKKPSFITGATAKVKIGNLTMAYAQDVSYNAAVTTIPIETMGRYEVVSNEPVAYFVDGTLSIIRYTAAATGAGVAIDGANTTTGNSVNEWNNTAGSGGNAGASFDPGRLISSETFDLEIFSKIPGDSAQPASGSSGTVQTESVIKLRDCRFTRKGGGINKRGVLVEQFAFNAILADNDSTTEVGTSGDQDLE